MFPDKPFQIMSSNNCCLSLMDLIIIDIKTSLTNLDNGITETNQWSPYRNRR